VSRTYHELYRMKTNLTQVTKHGTNPYYKIFFNAVCCECQVKSLLIFGGNASGLGMRERLYPNPTYLSTLHCLLVECVSTFDIPT
jgi:hypothetical protein